MVEEYIMLIARTSITVYVENDIIVDVKSNGFDKLIGKKFSDILCIKTRVSGNGKEHKEKKIRRKKKKVYIDGHEQLELEV